MCRNCQDCRTVLCDKCKPCGKCKVGQAPCSECPLCGVCKSGKTFCPKCTQCRACLTAPTCSKCDEKLKCAECAFTYRNFTKHKSFDFKTVIFLDGLTGEKHLLCSLHLILRMFETLVRPLAFTCYQSTKSFDAWNKTVKEIFPKGPALVPFLDGKKEEESLKQTDIKFNSSSVEWATPFYTTNSLDRNMCKLYLGRFTEFVTKVLFLFLFLFFSFSKLKKLFENIRVELKLVIHNQIHSTRRLLHKHFSVSYVEGITLCSLRYCYRAALRGSLEDRAF